MLLTQLHFFALLALALALTPLTSGHQHPIIPSSLLVPRGGASDNDDEENSKQIAIAGYTKLLKYRSDQQLLYQLRATYLSELLASRGVPLPTVVGVSTVEGERPAEKVDWDCALSTVDDPKVRTFLICLCHIFNVLCICLILTSFKILFINQNGLMVMSQTCLYSFDAEPNTKVLAPQGTTQYISLSALNRLRRTDPAKVEPMWHSQYAILQSWFSDQSEYSILQHVGIKGFLVSTLLDGRAMLRTVLITAILSVLVMFMPLIEHIVGRILVSAPFWSQWKTWGRIVRAGFPLKLLLGQLAWKGIAGVYSKLEEGVRDYFVDLECEILEESVPLTIGEVEEELDSASADDDEYDEDEY